MQHHVSADQQKPHQNRPLGPDLGLAPCPRKEVMSPRRVKLRLGLTLPTSGGGVSCEHSDLVFGR